MGLTLSNLVPTNIYAGGLYVDIRLGATPYNTPIFGIFLAIALSIAFTEIFGIHVPYSKFAHEDAMQELPANFLKQMFRARLGARFGYFVFYFVPWLGYLIIWSAFAGENRSLFGMVAPSSTYSVLLFVGWMLTFSKRCFEVLFVHIFSGTMPLTSSVLVAIAYTGAGLACAVYANQVVGYEAFGPQTRAKDVICVICYVIGFTVNAYAHYQLRLVRLKSNDVSADKKRYFAPEEIGILFKWFVCPHYVFEIVMFVSWSAFGATAVHWITAITIFTYLSLRTRATYQWYVKRGLIGGDSKTVIAGGDSKAVVAGEGFARLA